MLYMLMCYINENQWNKISQLQRDEIMQQYGLLMEQTKKSGHYRGGAMLSSVTAATTIRAREGKTIITDGPFAETKEQLGGYHLMECENLDEAISIASRIPTVRVGGTIEIRPVEMLNQK
jgi:hypothetical protein